MHPIAHMVARRTCCRQRAAHAAHLCMSDMLPLSHAWLLLIRARVNCLEALCMCALCRTKSDNTITFGAAQNQATGEGSHNEQDHAQGDT